MSFTILGRGTADSTHAIDQAVATYLTETAGCQTAEQSRSFQRFARSKDRFLHDFRLSLA